MNTVKKHLAELRDYLQRDPHGRKLLDEVTKDVNTQRKRIATLEKESQDATSRADRLYKETVHAQEEITALTFNVETETARRKSCEWREKRLSDRIKQLEEQEDIESQPDNGAVSNDSKSLRQIASMIKRAMKDVRRLPPPFPGTGGLRLEDWVHNYSRGEFQTLGMVASVLAVMNMPVKVTAERSLRDIEGGQTLLNKMGPKVFPWMREHIKVNPLHDEIYRRCN